MSRGDFMPNYSMLDLFRQEVETQVKSLRQSLSILKQQPALRGELDTAIRSLHAIAGSAQLVDIKAVAALSETMRVRLIAMQQNATTLSDALTDQLLHAGDLLVEMSEVTGGELDRWLSDHAEDLAQTQTAIVGSDVEAIPPTIQEVQSPPILAGLIYCDRRKSWGMSWAISRRACVIELHPC